MKKPQAKIARVMREFKSGELKSSSGQKVTNPKQAIAIGLSEAGVSKKSKGGEMKESKAMVKKEVSFMKKKGAPKSMIKHEMAEAGMKHSGGVKKMAAGGKSAPAPKPTAPSGKAAPFIPGQGGRGLPPPPPPRNQQIQNTTPPPGAIVPQRMTPQQAKKAGDIYQQHQRNQQLANSVSKPMQSIGGFGQANPQIASPIGGAAARALGLGMKKGGKVKKMAMGGMAGSSPPATMGRKVGPVPISDRNYPRPTKTTSEGRPARPAIINTKPVGPANVGMSKPKKMMASGGLAAGHKSADGIARKGKTKAEQIKMAKGGMAKSKKYC